MKIIKLPNGGELHDRPENSKSWWLNGKLHREDGPAIEYENGDKLWFLNGKLHREDDPAVECANGSKYWYMNGKGIPCTTQKEFDQYMRLRAFW